MIIKTISKTKIHPLFYIMAILTLITGFFKDFSYIMLIVLIHEIGHIIASIYCKWNIDKIVILPFGGLTVFDEKINKSLIEELLIAISGPIIQILVFSFCSNSTILKYHYSLLLFNLIPIIPLDGSKILNCLLNFFIPFKLVHKITIIFSMFSICLILIFQKNLTIFLILIFLIYKVLQELKNHKLVFNKFLMERYIYELNFKKRKIIKGLKLNSMFRNYKHLFYYDNKYHLEDEILKKKFDIKGLL